MDGAVQVSDANTAWLLIRNDEKSIPLTAHYGLPIYGPGK